MKFLLFTFLLLASTLAFPPRVLQILRILSLECSNHGYLWKGQCFCISIYAGPTCAQLKEAQFSDDAADKCDDLINNLDNLNNISPDFYLFDDDEFPRITKNSIDGSNTTGAWTNMHSISSRFHIFSNDTSALDIGQGALGDCYLLAAFASLANRNNGSILKSMFTDLNDNPKHVYTTRWLLNGKPRFIAVDDWVPGKGSSSSYTHVKEDLDFWPLILEKSYAKIHGSYSIIEGGWQTAVWQGISLARTFNQWHSSTNATALFAQIQNLFRQNFVVGAATISNTANNEVGGHAYSVLGVYEIKTDNGTSVKLVRYFNPWHSEVWATNPWGDNSANWTNYTKSQVPYLKGNDGIVFSTIEDYFANFGVTNWAEIHDDYDISFIDLAFNYDDLLAHPFEVNFTYYGNAGKDLYIFDDQSQGRLLLGCAAPVSISGFTVVSPNGTVFKASGDTVKITNAATGMYKAKFSMKKNQKFVHSFPLTAYAPGGNVTFIPPTNNTVVDLTKKQCPKHCSLQGSCNLADGTCRCFFGYEGADCSKIRNQACNCSSPYALCDQIFGKCLNPGLYNLGTNNYLRQGTTSYAEMGPVDTWDFVANGTSSFIKNINNKYLYLSDVKNKNVMAYNFMDSSYKNMDWNTISLETNRFAIRSNLSSILALIPAVNTTKLTLDVFNKTNPNHLWSWKVQPVPCPKDCSGHGVCSISTGICVCGVGFVGDACDLVEATIQ